MAIALIGILALATLPKLTSMISKAKSTEAQMQLEALHAMQQSYFYQHSRYSNDLAEIGFEQQKLATDGGTANYQIEIVESSPNSFKAQAIAVVDFDQDGQVNMWEINHEKQLAEVIKD